MHMQPMALIQPNVTPRYLPGMSHRQDPPRETPKALLLLTFFKILPNFILVRKSWDEIDRVLSVIITFLKFTL